MAFAISIFNISMNCVSLWIVHNFLGNFLNKKKINAGIILAWFSYGVLQFIVESYLKGNASLLTTCLSMLVVLWISAVGYEKSGKKKLFYVIILHVIWAITEMLVYFVTIHFPISEKEFEILGSVISKILMIIVIHILSICVDKAENEELSSVYYFSVLFIPLGSIYIAANVFFANEFTIMALIIFGILLLINIIIFNMYRKLAENLRLEREKTAYEKQIDLINQSMDEQKQIMDDFYEEKHNFINQLIGIKEIAEHGEQEKLVTNLEAIVSSYGKSERIGRSGNSMVDAILNFKYATARERGIVFDIKTFLPVDLPLRECDLGIILGNALDNAIEAVQTCKHHDKNICIFMGVKRGELIITIKNPYEHLIRQSKNGKLLSSKSDKKRHGYGINSIKKAAERYEGEVITEVGNDMFTLTVLITLKEL